MRDIVFPKGNEDAFIRMAAKLGITSLWFCYDHQSKFFTKPSPIPITNVLTTKKPGTTPRVVSATVDDIRDIIERVRPTIAYGLELSIPKDYIHQRASGINHIICELAQKNNVRLGFSSSLILRHTGMKQAQILGRMSQNIELYRKYHVDTVIASFADDPYDMRSPADLKSLFMTLGMHPLDAAKSLTELTTT